MSHAWIQNLLFLVLLLAIAVPLGPFIAKVLEGERTLERELQKMTAQTAGEICATDVITVNPTDQVSKAADTMSDHKLHALPVVEGKKLVGMVSRIDIIRSIIRT